LKLYIIALTQIPDRTGSNPRGFEAISVLKMDSN